MKTMMLVLLIFTLWRLRKENISSLLIGTPNEADDEIWYSEYSTEQTKDSEGGNIVCEGWSSHCNSHQKTGYDERVSPSDSVNYNNY